MSPKERAVAADRTHEKGFEIAHLLGNEDSKECVLREPGNKAEMAQGQDNGQADCRNSKRVLLYNRTTLNGDIAQVTFWNYRLRDNAQSVMRRHGLTDRIRQVRKVTQHAGKATGQQIPDNLLSREFQADKPMHRMVTDVPYFVNGE